MKTRFFLLLLAIFLCSCGKRKDLATSYDASRIVSFAPSITETLFALGLGPNVVGVSKFCEYPQEAARLPKVGGMIDPNLELVVRLKPSIVVLPQSNADAIDALQNLGIPCLPIRGTTLDDIINAFHAIGDPLGREKQAQELSDNITARLKAIQLRQNEKIPRVLLVIYREAGGVRNFQAAANDGYFSEIIRRAGGQLVPDDTSIPFPSLSAEAVLRLKPDHIIELLPAKTEDTATITHNAIADWQKDLPSISPDKIHILTDDYAVIPGPRFILLAEKIASLLIP